MRIWPSGGEGAAALLDDRKWAYLRMGTVEHLRLQLVLKQVLAMIRIEQLRLMAGKLPPMKRSGSS